MDERLTVLIVDDAPSARALLEALVTHAGHRTLSAGDVAEGLATLDAFGAAVDLVLTDYRMPGANGVDLVRAVRADARFRDLPVFVVSSEDDPAIRTAANAAGANAWVPKPICAASLLAAVAAVARLNQTGLQGDVGIPTYRRIHR